MTLKKRIFSLFLVTLLCCSLFTACGKSDDSSDDNSQNRTQNVNTNETQPNIQPQTSKPQPVEINIMMIGDMLMHTPVLKSGSLGGDDYDFHHLFKNILPDIQAADVRIVNQETILGGRNIGISGNFSGGFNSPWELGDAIVDAGFNVVLHATNHTLDRSLPAVESSLEFWKTKHPEIAVLGIHSSAEDAKNIYVYEKNGFKVAILNYTYGTNGIPIPSSAPYCVDTFDDEAKVRDDIRRAHQLADMVVVAPHWGTEYVYNPSSYQEEWTKVFLEEGVDLVLGTHPHVIEPVEMYERNDGHQMLVYYSLGNFVSAQDELARMIGGMAKVTLVKDDGACYIKNYSFEPVVTHKVYDSTEYTTYKLSDYTDALAANNAIIRDQCWCYTYQGNPLMHHPCYCGADQVGAPTHSSANLSVDYVKRFCNAVLGPVYPYN